MFRTVLLFIRWCLHHLYMLSSGIFNIYQYQAANFKAGPGTAVLTAPEPSLTKSLFAIFRNIARIKSCCAVLLLQATQRPIKQSRKFIFQLN